MAKLTMTTFLTLDGVMQAPGGRQEDTSGGFTHGGWLVPHVDEQFGAFMSEVFGRADAFLLGRGTWQIFAGWWPKVTDPADPVATALNRLPKHVASRTLDRADWSGSTFVRDVAGEVPQIKERYARELQVHGSPGLAQTLLQEDLLDELNLLVFPVALGGGGKRLFGSGTVPTAFELMASRTTGKGVVISTYRRSGLPSYGTVGG
ncbi:MAG TPA: dihydrofolate reductase family protein [Myxococcales bacterium]|jgi:dihydrofolate reductase